MVKTSSFLIVVVLLTACSAAQPEPIGTLPPTDTPIPTPLPTSTPVPESLTGTIFWDANGSGLQDDTSFIIPDFDPAEPPYFFELLAANGTGLGNLSPGELATVPEPPIPGIGVCLGDICTETGTDGTFTLQPEKAQSIYNLKFRDPNQGNPTKAFRYINQWNAHVVIESYEMNDVAVPDQHLNDTEVIDIGKGTIISTDKENEIGLVQGFLTLPYLIENWDTFFVSNFVDLDIKTGSVRNFLGDTTKLIHPNTDGIGTVDQHYGVDYLGQKGDFVLSAGEGKVGYSGETDTGRFGYAKGVGILHNMQLQSNSGHFDEILTKNNEVTYRGMVIGKNGSSGSSMVHIHFGLYDLEKVVSGRPLALDPYMDVFEGDISIVEYENLGGQTTQIGSIGYWTVVNIPQFPLVEIIE